MRAATQTAGPTAWTRVRFVSVRQRSLATIARKCTVAIWITSVNLIDVACARTDGRSVFLNSQSFPTCADDSVQNLNGLMYHLQVYVSPSPVHRPTCSPTHLSCDPIVPRRIFRMQSPISHLHLPWISIVRRLMTMLSSLFVLRQPQRLDAKRTPARR